MMASPVKKNPDLTVAKAREVVKHIVAELHKLPRSRRDFPLLSGINVSEVVEGGSLGHGTVVPGYFDVDLIILSRDIHPEMVIYPEKKGHSSDILRELDKFLNEKLNTYSRVDMTTRSITFFVEAHSEEKALKVDVDLLISPFWDNTDQMFTFLSDFKSSHEENWSSLRTVFSPAASKWQTEFIRKKPNCVKELIRRTKTWKLTRFKESDLKPKSYLLEVLVIEACNRYCDKHGTNLEYFHDNQLEESFVLEVQDILKDLFHDHQSLRLMIKNPWYVYGDWSGNPLRNCDFKSEEPYIMDPANPYNNLYQSGLSNVSVMGAGRTKESMWDSLRAKIKTLDLTKSVQAYDY